MGKGMVWGRVKVMVWGRVKGKGEGMAIQNIIFI